MESPPDHSDHHGSLSSPIRLLIMAASLALASSVGFYLHPHLLPFLSHSLPHLWLSAPPWLTAPSFLFLLLNLVVASLYFSSTLFSSPPHPPPPRIPSPPSSSPTTSSSNDHPPQPADVAPAANSSISLGALRARIEKSKPILRLVRSKSEQIPPSLTKVEASGSRLKKAGTFEAAAKGTKKPIVIVADPPEDESGAAPPPGHEEVDKKAEDFISRFYQKVKLQRLDSLLRNQQSRQPA